MPLAFGSPPTLVNDLAGPWMDGIRTFSADVALGAVASLGDFSFVASFDAGATWVTTPFAAPVGGFSAHIGWENDTYAMGGICFDESSDMGLCNAYHNLGNVSQAAEGNHTEYNASATGVFRLLNASQTNSESLSHSTGPGVAFTGIPPPGVTNFRVEPSANIRLRDQTLLGTVVVTLPDDPRRLLSVIAFRSVDNGSHWHFVSVVASAMQVPYAHEGPSENALARLHNGSLLCVMRVEGESGHHSPYISVVSDNEGRTWHSLRSLANRAGCVRPRLLSLDTGGLVLAGGRPNATSHDVLLWHNAKRDGEDWRPYSVSYWHNRLTTNQSWIWPPAATNFSRWPRYSRSYTSLVKTGADQGYVVYEAEGRGFTLAFRFVTV